MAHRSFRLAMASNRTFRLNKMASHVPCLSWSVQRPGTLFLQHTFSMWACFGNDRTCTTWVLGLDGGCPSGLPTWSLPSCNMICSARYSVSAWRNMSSSWFRGNLVISYIMTVIFVWDVTNTSSTVTTNMTIIKSTARAYYAKILISLASVKPLPFKGCASGRLEALCRRMSLQKSL